MRIGNLDDLDKSENPEDLAKLIQSGNPDNMKKSKKWKNWWHYYKWYVVCGILLLGIACNLIGNALGLWEKSPDFQIAYIGQTELPQTTKTALEEAFSQLEADFIFSSSGMDFNNDGECIVRINQYIDNPQSIEYASEITLIADITDCESYFFLMDNPDDFQKKYQLLASYDGSCPDETDYSTEDKVILWSDCPALSAITASVEAKAPGSSGLLSQVYIGRRCFYTDTVTDNYEKCSGLWDLLINGKSNNP